MPTLHEKQVLFIDILVLAGETMSISDDFVTGLRKLLRLSEQEFAQCLEHLEPIYWTMVTNTGGGNV